MISETEFASIEISQSGLVNIRLKSGWKIEPEHIQELQQIILQNTSGFEKIALIIEAEEFVSVSDESRKMVSGRSFAKKSVAMAFIGKNLAQTIIINFFIRINKPSTPTKFFTSKEEAERWTIDLLS